MGRCRKAGWLVWAACLVCLPGALHAQSRRVYTVPVPGAGPQSRLEWSVGSSSGRAAPGDVISTTAGDWEVTVEFDAANCAVYCAYRRLREPDGRTPEVDLLALPVTTIRFYADFGSRPVMATVDPAGRGMPRAAGLAHVSFEQACTDGRRVATAGLVRTGESLAMVCGRVNACPVTDGDSVSITTAPLRI